MSDTVELDISLALETALQGIVDITTPAIQTSDENVDFTPTTGVPYQDITTHFAAPENPSLGDDFYRVSGFMQISLKYPLGNGKADAYIRAGLIKKQFKKDLSFVKNGVTATISKTPEIRKGEREPDRYVVNVFVRFFANIGD